MRCTAERRDHRYSEGALPVRGDQHASGDVQHHLDGGAGVRDPGARPDRFCAVAGRAFVTSVNTHPRGLPLRGFLLHNHCDCTDSHCNSHIVTSCVFVPVLHSHHKSIGGRLLLLPQAARDGLALCHLSRQDTSREFPLRVGTGARCVRVEGSRSLA